MKKVILIILSMLGLVTLVSCSKEENSNDNKTSMIVEEDTNISSSENEQSSSNDEVNANKEVIFDGFIYGEYTGETEKTRKRGTYLNYSLNTAYDGTYSEEERLLLKNIHENICQALFYGDSYKEKDKTFNYVMSFVIDEKLEEEIKSMFKAKMCDLVAATYTDDKIEYDKSTIWTGETYTNDKLPYIRTEWVIKYKRYDKYGVEAKGGENRFDLTFIKKDKKWLLTKIETW